MTRVTTHQPRRIDADTRIDTTGERANVAPGGAVDPTTTSGLDRATDDGPTPSADGAPPPSADGARPAPLAPV